MQVFDALTHSSFTILTTIIVIETLLVAFLLMRSYRIHQRVLRAEHLAADSARAAAMAVPGGIDPEVVMRLLKAGQPVTVDTVLQMMERQSGTESTQRR